MSRTVLLPGSAGSDDPPLKRPSDFHLLGTRVPRVDTPDKVTGRARYAEDLLPTLKRLQRNGFKAIAPGIESWFDIGDKSKMRRVKGMEKVERAADHLNLIHEYIPYVQGNLIFGLDGDGGAADSDLHGAAPRLRPALSGVPVTGCPEFPD